MKKIVLFIFLILLALNTHGAQPKLTDYASIKCEALLVDNIVQVFLIIINKYDSAIHISLNQTEDITITLKDENGVDAVNLAHGGSWYSNQMILTIPKGSELKWLVTPVIGSKKVPTFCMPFKIWEIPRDKISQYRFDLEVKGSLFGRPSASMISLKNQTIKTETNPES